MVKKSKGKHRLDKYYHLAKEQGFRSRAAFKLIQLNRKYNFFSNCKALLDLCAAPGGWMQVAAKSMPLGSLIIGVDLMPIKPIRGAKSFVADITTAKCRQLLKKEAAGSVFDVVCHDGAPNVGGAWSSEAYTQSALVVDALALAVEFLAPGGTFVTKVFRSKDYNALLYALGQLFNKVEATKPQASRNASAEIFVVCLGYKAPAKVDQRLLDAKVLFQEVIEAPKVVGPEALLKQKIKQKRHREGYEDGLSSSHKAFPATAFLLSDTPVEMLGQATQLLLSGTAAEQPGVEAHGDERQIDYKVLADAIRSHPAMNNEVTALCKDLQVLGRSEFKQLLRWRLQLRKDLKHLLGDAAAGADGKKAGSHTKAAASEPGEGDDDATQVDPEQRLLDEMAAIKEQSERRLRREKRRRRELKKKAKVRAAQLLMAEGGTEQDAAPDGEQLFSLGVIRPSPATSKDKSNTAAATVLRRVANVAAPGEQELELLEAGSSDDKHLSSDNGSDLSSLDSEEEALDYDAQLEEQLEDAYQQYLHRQGVRDAAAKEKRQRLGQGGELGNDDQVGPAGAGAGAGSSEGEEDQDQYAARLQGMAEETSEDKEAGAGGGLLVKLDANRVGVAKGGAAAAAQWFGQDLFDDPNVGVSSDEEDGDDSSRALSQAGAAAERNRMNAASTSGRGATAAAEGADSSKQLKHKVRQQQRAGAATAAADAEGSNEDTQINVQSAAKKHKAATGAAVPTSANGQANVQQNGNDSLARFDDSDSDDGCSSSEVGGSNSDDDSDADEFDALHDAGKAEVLALAKRMLRRKDKESIVEAAYNRYAFHDSKLPRWFFEDEARHMRPLPQVSKVEVEEEKARLAAIDARPIKKVAEAKARKRKRMQARLDVAKQKATSVAAQEDMPMASKMREIEKIYSKARKANGVKGSKGSSKAANRKGPALDNRMKKDKRGLKRAAKRAGGKQGRKGAAGGKRGGRAVRR